MLCPFCNATDTKVIDSRVLVETNQIKRRRHCLQCEARFSTKETVELNLPRVIKMDGRRVAFDENKLRMGILKSLEKRKVSMEQIDNVVKEIMTRIQGLGEREISTQQIGEYVMKSLHTLDPVAYVRFASVYRRFEDIEAFRKEIKRLQELLVE